MFTRAGEFDACIVLVYPAGSSVVTVKVVEPFDVPPVTPPIDGDMTTDEAVQEKEPPYSSADNRHHDVIGARRNPVAPSPPVDSWM